MRFSLSCAVLFLSFQVNGQKLVLDGVDKFSKSHVQETSKIELSNDKRTGVEASFFVKAVDSFKYFGVYIRQIHGTAIANEKPLTLLFDDESTESLPFVTSDAARYYGARSYQNIVFQLPESLIHKLKSQKVKAVRMNGYDWNIDLDLSKKGREAIAKALALITI